VWLRGRLAEEWVELDSLACFNNLAPFHALKLLKKIFDLESLPNGARFMRVLGSAPVKTL